MAHDRAHCRVIQDPLDLLVRPGPRRLRVLVQEVPPFTKLLAIDFARTVKKRLRLNVPALDLRWGSS